MIISNHGKTVALIRMLSFFKSARFFLVLTLLSVFWAFFFLFLIEKGDATIWFNNMHTYEFDILFKSVTFFGDGRLIALLLIAVVLWKRYQGVLIIVSLTITSALNQFLKRVVFEWDRPAAILGEPFYHAEGIEIHRHFSFPSGHTVGAFSLFFLLSLLNRNPLWQVLCWFLATLTAISRMYLFQHFLVDVTVGALFGVTFSAIFYYFLDQKTDLRRLKYLQ